MSDKEVESEANIMPPKAMIQEAINKLVQDMLSEAQEQDTKKGKGKITKWGDEDADVIGVVIEKELEKDQKMFLDALKALNKDILDGLPIYSGSLNGEELLDWIEALNNHFEYKEVAEEKRVNMAKTNLKVSALVWWNMMQEEREQTRRKKINSWERMKIRIKTQFPPLDYEVQIHKKLMSLKQREMDVSSYIEEFNKPNLRERKKEEEVEKVARYLNGP